MSSGACNQFGDERSGVVGALCDVVRRDPAQWVVDDDHPRVDHSAPRGLVAGEWQERCGAHEQRDGAS